MLLRRSYALCAALLLASPAAIAGDADKKGGDEKKDRATKDDYEIDTAASSATLKVGAGGEVSIVIKPKNKTKIHPQAPLEVRLKQPEGISLEKKKLNRADVQDKEAKSPDLRTTLRADKSGEHKIECDVSFFLCTDAWCQRMTDSVSIAVKVEE